MPAALRGQVGSLTARPCGLRARHWAKGAARQRPLAENVTLTWHNSRPVARN